MFSKSEDVNGSTIPRIFMQNHKDFSSLGQFYVSDCKNCCKLKVYDEVSDFQSKHIGDKMHLRNS